MGFGCWLGGGDSATPPVNKCVKAQGQEQGQAAGSNGDGNKVLIHGNNEG
ncbi:MAG: hypothetical protein RSE13_00050 [Planktothrix sp. GU0601_MAG3]|nr:MAG: hypothetical protein RSE13_00050 [Planktothrix sp. GU0601_MAG3]